MNKEKFYITTPIFYPNGVPHIGHAYNMLATDAIARFNRLQGRDVLHLTGTDEHGLKMQQTAQREGITSQELADRNSKVFRQLSEALNCAPDDFLRTTEPRHHRAVQAIWERMKANGDIYLDKYAGWYSVRQEAFFDEKETTVGEDGVRREPLGSPVEWVEEESYFFRLSAYGDKLLAHYAAHPGFIAPPERSNEVVSFVRSGLKDLSVSRTTFDWGVPVPGDERHVMYVWVDALTNYLTGAGFPDEDSSRWHYWPADVHMIGKDIIRFHAVYWPAFLMSAGIALPKRVFAHGFLLNRGEKMSKSVGNVVDPFQMIEEFGADTVRYFFLREVPFGQDGSYNREAIVNRANADLANDFGNLAQRSLTMIARNCDSRVPTPGAFNKDDEALLASADAAVAAAVAAMDSQLIHEALAALWEVVAEANRYFAAQEPWALRKSDFQRMETVLYVTAEVIRRLAIPALAFIPASAGRLLDSLSVGGAQWSIDFAGDKGKLRPGTMLPVPEPIFRRFERPKAE